MVLLTCRVPSNWDCTENKVAPRHHLKVGKHFIDMSQEIFFVFAKDQSMDWHWTG